MNFFKKILCCAAPLAVLLLTGCPQKPAVQGGTVPPVLMVSTLAGQAGVNGSADGTGAAASFNGPFGVTADAAGNIYVGDKNNTIRKISPAGVVTTLAGTAGVTGSADGTGAAASFNGPSGVTADAAGNIYVGDANSTIRKISPAGVVTTLSTLVITPTNRERLTHTLGIAVDTEGTIYVADHLSNTIRLINRYGEVFPLAGQAGVEGSADGTGAAASFNGPASITLDSKGNLYVTDIFNHTIRKITQAGGVTTFAGTAGVSGHADGTGAAASFFYPIGVAADAADNLYVTDFTHTIRKITPAGVVSTLAGKTGVEGNADGTATVARFFFPSGISIDPKGNIYVADAGNHTIRKIGPGYHIGGTLSGLSGALILQNSNGDTKTLSILFSTNNNFTMDMPVAENATYSVTVQTQPAGQSCTVTGGSGTATAHVSNISVSCSGTAATAYTIGGTVSGLTGTLLLQNSNGDKQSIAANGSFTFTAPVAQAGAYSVTVKTQPTGQTCTVSSGNGTAAANVGNISVSCATSTHTIGGTVSGLTGTLALQNNGADTLVLTANAPFTFVTPVAYNGAYNVTVLNQPAGQTCTVRDILGATSGTATANVDNISVSCVANTYTVGGAVSGLTGWVVLQNNGGNNLFLTANGNITFSGKITHGNTYNVTVQAQPTGQTCTVTSGGTATANVNNVAVSCVTNTANTYTVGGSVTGLTGMLVLQNGGDNLTLNANGNFTFTTPVSGAYSVTVQTPPTGQTCSVTSGGGTATANVNNVAVSCVTNTANTYTVGGSVTGLTGTLVLQNGGDNLTLNANGNFTFATPVSTYNVIVQTNPAGQTCTVTNGGGVATADVNNVAVSCVTDTVSYTISGVVNNLGFPGLELQNNGVDTLMAMPPFPAPGNSPFTFAAPVTGAYNVTVFTQPGGGQTCTVTSGGTGTAAGNVSDVVIDCLP